MPEVAAACASLRESMHEADGRGAWYCLYLRRDQELYPRPPELLPSWHPSR